MTAAEVAAADVSRGRLRRLVEDEVLVPRGLCQVAWQPPAREVVAFSDARSESALEPISRVAFRDHGLPPPRLQVWVGRDEDQSRSERGRGFAGGGRVGHNRGPGDEARHNRGIPADGFYHSTDQEHEEAMVGEYPPGVDAGLEPDGNHTGAAR